MRSFFAGGRRRKIDGTLEKGVLATLPLKAIAILGLLRVKGTVKDTK